MYRNFFFKTERFIDGLIYIKVFNNIKLKEQKKRKEKKRIKKRESSKAFLEVYLSSNYLIVISGVQCFCWDFVDILPFSERSISFFLILDHCSIHFFHLFL